MGAQIKNIITQSKIAQPNF